MKILTFTSLYPNSVFPQHGLFVEQRLRRLVESGKVSAEVVAPIPWFPFRVPGFGRYAKYAEIPSQERRHGILVNHPRYPVIPKIGMNIAPRLMARWMRTPLKNIVAAGRDFDLIDAHYFYPDGVAAAILSNDLSKPCVITARGSDINLIAKFPAPKRQILRAAESAERIVAVSGALRDELCRLGVSEERIVVLRNGVDLELFQPRDKSASRRQLGISESHQTLLMVGHLTSVKGHHLVIEALSQMPDVFLMIVGDGPLRVALGNQVKRSSLSERVRFFGAIPQTDLSLYYSAADVSVLASEREGMPNVILESLACGTPVVATAVGGVPEILTGPATGALMADRSSSALVEAVSTLFRNMPDSAGTRAHSLQFDWRSTTEGQLSLFSQIIGQTSSA